MYDLEHVALFDAIRKDQPINNGNYMATSSALAILAREVCYTGQEITWEQADEIRIDFRVAEIRLGRPAAGSSRRQRPLSHRHAGHHGVQTKPRKSDSGGQANNVF